MTDDTLGRASGRLSIAVPLGDAGDAVEFGAKAANLARCASAGLRVPAGVVVGTSCTQGPPSQVRSDLSGSLSALWERLEERGVPPLVVRSSSPQEDTASSSMAGRFESVVGIESEAGFLDAFERVVASRDEVRDSQDVSGDIEVAVLVQALIDARVGGVLFTVDPVTGERDRAVVSASPGGAEPVVSGKRATTRYVLDRRDGSVVDVDAGEEDVELDADARQQLCELADELEGLFEGPQDVEWAIDGDGALWLLQSRPIARVRRIPIRAGAEVPDDHPILGPGPVAETFPEALAPLEQDLWLPPLDEALRHVFRLIGSASEGDVDASPVVVALEGRVAVDLDLFGVSERDEPWWRFFDPRPRIRNLRTAWRVGRLRASLVALGGEVVDDVDERLARVPELDGLTDRQLLGLLDRTQAALVSVHAHEVLIGLLVGEEVPSLTGPSVALRVLATSREDGSSDEEIVRQHPIVLSLSPPRICARHLLPETPSPLPPRPVTGEDADATLVLREALRIRVRWLQELHATVCLELGRRLVERGVIERAPEVRAMKREELDSLVLGRAVAWQFDREERLPTGAPLPSAFCLIEDGSAIVPTADGTGGGGTGAGGGVGRGQVHIGDDPQPGDVAVVHNLDPALGGVVGRLAGLVAETGSVLAHIAILAREAGVPTVVGLDYATQQLEEGQTVEVDGDDGTVKVVDG